LAVRPWAKAKTMVPFYWNIRKLQNSFWCSRNSDTALSKGNVRN
jgi:hypothetical protein